MNNQLNVNEIIKIEQMPKVFSQLEKIGAFIDKQIKNIDILDCTEENKQDIKKRRTEINNILKELDDRRKFIKNKILEPYEMFNDKYEQECKGKLVSASEILKTKIDSIEEQQKKQKRAELYDFAMEYFVNNNIADFVTFDDIDLNITLSASMKSLKEQIIDFCEKVKQDLELIKMEEYKNEILVEYSKCKNFAQAKLEVIERHRQLDTLEISQQKIEEIEQAQQRVSDRVEEIISEPIEIDEEEIKVAFVVTGTRTQIRELKEFLNMKEIRYE